MGLSTSAEKLEWTAKLTFHRITKDFERYLGLTGWLRSYIPYYAAFSEPLQACKKNMFKSPPAGKHTRKSFASTSLVDLLDELKESFQALQLASATPSMLNHFDRGRPLYIHVDA